MAKAIHQVTSPVVHMSSQSSSYGLNKNKANPPNWQVRVVRRVAHKVLEIALIIRSYIRPFCRGLEEGGGREGSVLYKKTRAGGESGVEIMKSGSNVTIKMRKPYLRKQFEDNFF